MRVNLDDSVNYYCDSFFFFKFARRFKGKTAGQVRKEALANENKASFPIADNPKYVRYWEHIAQLKARATSA